MENRYTATVYYRGSFEHLNENADTSLVDAGHTFIGIENHQTGETIYLDINKDDETGSWDYIEPNSERLEDHHTTSWNLTQEQYENGIQAINDIKNSEQEYALSDNNCTDSVGMIIQSMGYNTFDHSESYEYPTSFGERLQDFFNQNNVDFHNDANMSYIVQSEDVFSNIGIENDFTPIPQEPDLNAFSNIPTEGGEAVNDIPFTIIENPDVKDPLLETFNIPSPFDILTEPTNEFPPPIVDNQGTEWNTQLNDPWAENTTSQEPLSDIWATETKSTWESDPINPNPTDDWNTPANDIWGSSNPSNQDPVNESWNTPTNTDIWANQTTVENSVNDWNSPNNDSWANDTTNQTPSNDSWNTPNNDSWANDSSSQSLSNDSSSDT